MYLLPIFQKGFFVTEKSVKPCFVVCEYVPFYLLFDTIFSKILLVNSGDTETNPGPRKSSPIKFCHWNLNGLAAHDFIKLPLIEPFITTHNFDILCLSETFLDLTIDLNDENINIDGYFILRADHPSNNKQGGVCIYFKQSLPLIRKDDLSTIQGTIVTEISVENETYFLTCLYWSPSQSHDELESFCSELNLLLTNINNNQPACSILISDFNAKCSKWCSSDKNNIAGLKIDNITTTAGYSQLINKPTHFMNGTSSCLDLIFSSNVSFIRNYEIKQSIYEKCHHNITYSTLDFNVPLPPPYYREIWDYKNADTESIQKAISSFDWPKAFRNKNASENCKLLMDTLMNIFINYIPHKTKKFGYKTPEWMNTLIIFALTKGRYLKKGTIEIPLNIIRRHY